MRKVGLIKWQLIFTTQLNDQMRQQHKKALKRLEVETQIMLGMK
jgi:hypothetical protein